MRTFRAGQRGGREASSRAVGFPQVRGSRNSAGELGVKVDGLQQGYVAVAALRFKSTRSQPENNGVTLLWIKDCFAGRAIWSFIQPRHSPERFCFQT